MEVRILVSKDVGVDGAERRLRLVFNSIVEGLDDLFLEARGPRKGVDDGGALRLCES
jgi:hypothetical protein